MAETVTVRFLRSASNGYVYYIRGDIATFVKEDGMRYVNSGAAAIYNAQPEKRGFFGPPKNKAVSSAPEKK